MVKIEWLWTNQNVQGVGRPLGFRTQKSSDERSKELDVSLGLLVSLTFRNNLHQQQPEPQIRGLWAIGAIEECQLTLRQVHVTYEYIHIYKRISTQADLPVILQRRPSSYAHHSIGELDRDRQIPF